MKRQRSRREIAMDLYLEVGLVIPRFGRRRAARPLEQPGLQGAYARRFPDQETAVS
jgi:hypothetical protein